MNQGRDGYRKEGSKSSCFFYSRNDWHTLLDIIVSASTAPHLIIVSPQFETADRARVVLFQPRCEAGRVEKVVARHLLNFVPDNEVFPTDGALSACSELPQLGLVHVHDRKPFDLKRTETVCKQATKHSREGWCDGAGSVNQRPISAVAKLRE